MPPVCSSSSPKSGFAEPRRRDMETEIAPAAVAVHGGWYAPGLGRLCAYPDRGATGQESVQLGVVEPERRDLTRRIPREDNGVRPPRLEGHVGDAE